MGKQHWRGGNMLYPVPAVMVTTKDAAGTDNIITVAWVGTVCSDPAMLSISVRKERHSHKALTETKEFVVNLVTRDLTWATDYCGVKSGRDVDKFADCHLTKQPSQKVAPCGIAESPVNIECRVTQILPLGSHDLFLAEVVGVSVDEEYLDAKGRFALEETDLIAYSHGEYYALGDYIGKFGYSIQKKKRNPKKK